MGVITCKRVGFTGRLEVSGPPRWIVMVKEHRAGTGKRRGKLGFGVCFALISTVISSNEVSVCVD